MALRPRPTARGVLPTPGGTVTYCAVSAIDHRSLSLAPARRPDADGHELAAHGRRAPRIPLPARRRDVELPARVDDLTPRPPFHVVVMSEESRLGREAIETAWALKRITDAGVRVFCCLDNRERTLDAPTDKVLLSLTAFG